jgi:hypothetical protein
VSNGKRPSIGGFKPSAWKCPVAVEKPAKKRAPRHAPDGENSDSKPPIWRFNHVDFDGPFGWSKLSLDQLKELQRSMSSMEAMTWQDIARTESHFLTHGISKEAMTRLEEIGQDDAADILYSMRISGKRRIIGIRVGREFSILWWDPDHQVCPSQKKHT